MKKKNATKSKFTFPDFDKMTYEEEATWWDTHSFADFWNELDDVEVIWALQKPKTETVIVRLQKSMKDQLEKRAKAKGVTVSTLTRMYILEKLMKPSSNR